MKNYGLLLATLLLVGCGGSSDSSPARDGKGDIDVVSYLPSISMEKAFSGSVDNGSFVGLKRVNIVTVTDHEIVEETIQYSTIHGLVYEHTFQINTTYNEENITVQHSDKTPNIESFYRYIDDSEIKNTKNKEYSTDFINNKYDIVVGTLAYTENEVCKYKKINKIIIQEKVVAEGDFLSIVCKNTSTKTYHLNQKYLDLDANYPKLNNKKEKEITTTINYYKRDIGFFGLSASSNDGSSNTYLLLKEEG